MKDGSHILSQLNMSIPEAGTAHAPTMQRVAKTLQQSVKIESESAVPDAVYVGGATRHDE